MRCRIWKDSNFPSYDVAKGKRREEESCYIGSFDDKSTYLPSTNINGFKLFTILSGIEQQPARVFPFLFLSLRPEEAFFSGMRNSTKKEKRPPLTATVSQEEQTSATISLNYEGGVWLAVAIFS